MICKPRPVRAPRVPGNGMDLCCPECGSPTLFAESVNYDQRNRCSWDGDAFAVTKLRCTACASSITVETSYHRLRGCPDLDESLAGRAGASLRDPEQEKRDKAAADIERMARELTAKAARVRRGELP